MSKKYFIPQSTPTWQDEMFKMQFQQTELLRLQNKMLYLLLDGLKSQVPINTSEFYALPRNGDVEIETT
jgi:hypothetical protein